MKPRRILSTARLSFPLASAIAAMLAAPSASAVNLYWDTDGTTPGSGAAAGTWGTDLFWSSDSTGSIATANTTTTGLDDLFFSAGTTGTGGIITVNGAQNARLLTLEEGALTFSGGTGITLAGGGITVLAGAGNATISTALTLNGNNTFNVGASRTLTLDTGAFTRGTRATLNVQGAGTVISTKAGLTAAAPWISFGTGTSTTFAKFSGSNIAGLGYSGGADGVNAAASTNVVTLAGGNYTLGAAGTLGTSASINTLRWTGGIGTLATATSFTTLGIMNSGTGLLTFSGAVTSGAAATEMVVNTANNNIQFDGIFTGTITKTGSGTMTLGAAAHSIGGWSVNEGILVANRDIAVVDQLPGGTVNSGGTLRTAGGNSRFSNNAVFTVNAGGTWDIFGVTDQIGGVVGAGLIVNTAAGTANMNFNTTGNNTFSGLIGGGGGGAFGVIINGVGGTQAFTGLNTYTGVTDIRNGSLSINTIKNVGVASSIGAPAIGNAPIRFGNTNATGTLVYTGTGDETNRVINLFGTTGGGTITQSGSGLLKFTSNLSVPGTAATDQRKTLTLNGSTAGAGEISGIISDAVLGTAGQLATSLTKSGSGTWTLSNANTYTGSTTLNGGTLKYTVDNTAIKALNFGVLTSSGTGTNNVGSTTVSTIDASTTPSALTATSINVFTNSASANTITIGSGKVLTSTGGLTMGFDGSLATTLVTSTPKLTVSGAGSFAITGGDVNIGANQATANANNKSIGTLDLSGLNGASGFSANVTNFNVGFGSSVAGVLTLANTANSITATTLRVGDSNGDNPGGASLLTLGTGTNILRADTINVGFGKNASQTGLLEFASHSAGSPGTVTINNKVGSGAAAITIGLTPSGANTGSNATGEIDFTGHQATVTASTLTIASNANSGGSGTAAPIGILSIDTSSTVFNATTLNMSAITSATSTFTTTSTLNIGGGAFAVSGTANVGNNTATSGAAPGSATIALSSGTLTFATLNVGVKSGAGTGSSTGILNVSGGSMTVNTAFTLGSQATAGTSAGTLNITGSGSVTVNATSGITKSGTTTSTITLNGASASLDMNGRNITGMSTITYTNGLLKNLGTVNTGMTLAGTGSRVFDQAVSISGEVQGIITGSGIGLTKQGLGTLTLSGANSYSGGTSITAGKLIAQGNVAALGNAAGVVDVGGSATLHFNNNFAVNNTALTVGNAITGAGTLEFTGSAAPTTAVRRLLGVGSLTGFTGNISILANGNYLVDTSNDTTNQNITIASSGYLTLSTSVNAGFGKLDGAGTVLRNSGTTSTSTLTLGNNNATGGVFSGVIRGESTAANSGLFDSSGILAVTKVGTGTQTLSGQNLYAGATTVSDGTLRAGALAGGQAFGNGSAVTTADLATAILDLNGFSQTIGSLAGGGTTGGNVTLGADAILTTGGNNGTTAYGGIISGTGTSGLTKTGNGIMTLSGINTYTGTTSVNGGTLALSGSGTAGSAGSQLDVNGGIFDLGGTIQTKSGVIRFLSGTISNGTITKSGADYDGQAGLVSANLGGGVGLIKTTGGTLTLSGTSVNYTGATTVSAGTLNITGSTGAPLSTSALTVAGGATLNTVNTVGQIVNLSGAINLGAGGGTTTLGLDIGSLSNFDQFNGTGAATTANAVVLNLTGLGGIVAGNYDLLTAGSGLDTASYTFSVGGGGGFSYLLTNDPTFVRLTTAALAAGNMYWGGAVNTSWAGFNGSSDSNFANDIGGTNAKGTPGIDNNLIFSTSTQTATSLATTLDGAFSIRDLTFNNQVGSGPLSSISIGPGTGGTLTLTPTADTAGINVETGAPASIALSAPVTLGGNQTWTVVDVATNLASSGGIGGTANLIKAGVGIVTLSGTNNYVGTTTVNAGVLRAGDTNGFNNTSAHMIGASGTLRLNGFNSTVDSLAGAAGAIVENGAASGNVALTAGGNNTSTTYAGTLQNGAAATLGLTKLGTGKLTLTGGNTHTGATTINGGRLEFTTGITNTSTGSFTTGSAAATRGMLLVGTDASITTNDMDFGSNATGAGAGYQTAGAVVLTAADGTGLLGIGNATGGYGYYKMAGGTLTSNRITLVNLGAGAGTTGIFHQTDGIVTANAWTTVGHGAGSALLDIEGGTYNSGTNFALGVNDAGAYSVFNVRGAGTFIAANGSTILSNRGDNANRDNMVNILNFLSGGTVRTASGGITNGTTNGAVNNLVHINLNGGTIITNQASANLININNTNSTLTANSGAFVYSGGVTIDTNGLNSTIPAALQAPSGVGVASVPVTTAGSGYIGAPFVKLTGGTGTGATAVANMVDDGTGNGTYRLDTITITNPGTGYLNGDVLTVSFGDNTSVYTTQATLGAVTMGTSTLASGGLTKDGVGTLTLSGANTYTGGTTINLGSVALGANDRLANTGNVTLAGGILDVATFNDTVATVSLQSGAISGSTGVLTSTANYELQSGTVNFTGIGGLAGAFGLNKTTAGTVTLSGATNLNSFTGGVSVTGGTLAFATSNHLGDAASLTNTLAVSGGSTLQFTDPGAVNLGANRVLTIGAGGAILDVTQSTGVLTLPSIAGASTGNLTKTGVGSVVIGTTTSLDSGAGSATISDGKLTASFGTGGINHLTVGATGNMSFQNGTPEVLTLSSGVLTLGNGSRLGFDLGAPGTNDQILTSTAASVPGSSTITLDFSNLGGIATGSYNLITATGGLNNATYVLGSGITGWKLVPNATSTLVSLGVTPFTPTYWRGGVSGSWNTLGTDPFNWTTDSSGTIGDTTTPGTADTVVFSALGAPFSSGSEITTTLDAAFTIDSLLFNNVPATISAVTINGGTGGTLTLAPTSTVDGIDVQANAGTITLNAPLTAFTAQRWTVSNVGAGTELVVGSDTTFTAAVTKSGLGTLTLSGTNGGAGGFSLAAGTLKLASNNALGTGTFTVAPGATLDATGSARTLNNGVNAWNGNFTFTGSNNLDLGAGGVILGGNVLLTASASTLTVGGGIDDGAATFGLTKSGNGALVLNGANGYDGLTNLTAGTLTLVGNNSGASGGVTMAATTTLNLNSNNALGTGTFTINGGTLDATVAGVTDAGATAQTWNSSFAFTGTNSLNLGAGTVTLGLSPTITTSGAATTLTTGPLVDGASVFGITKDGPGTLALGGVSIYEGVTVINRGTLKFTTGTQNLANTLLFGATAANTTPGILDLATANATVAGAMIVNTNLATASEIQIGSGKTLTLNGNVQIGATTPAVSGADAKLTMSGGGSLNVATAAAGTFVVGGTTGGNSQSSILDLTGLASATINVSSTGTVRVNQPTGTNLAGNKSSLLLPTPVVALNTAVTTITAANFNVGDNGGNGAGAEQVNSVTLGTGLTTLNMNTVNAGTGSRDFGQIIYAPGNGTVKLRAADGTNRAAFNLGTGNANTGVVAGTGVTNNVDLVGHSADLMIGTLAIGAQNRLTNRTDTFAFDTGTLDATTVVLATNTGTASNSAGTFTPTWTSNLNIGGGSTIIGTGGVDIAFGQTATTNGSQIGTKTIVGNFNISGGTVTIANNATFGAAIRMSNNVIASSLIANSNLNITGGTLTLAGHIIKGATTGVGSATVTLDGASAVLDMGGSNIGAASPTVTFNARQGTLRNLSELNGGGTLSKSTAGTLVMDTGNGYTGLTDITAGVVQIKHGSALGTIAAGTTISNLAALEISGGITTLAENLTLNGSGVGGTGALRSTAGTNTFAGAINLATSSTIRADDGTTLNLSGGIAKNGTTLTLLGGAAGSGIVNVTGAITGASAGSDLVVDGLTVNANVANTYNGPTLIRSTALAGSGILNATVVNALPTASGRSTVTMDDSGLGGSTLALTASQSIASLTSAASSSLVTIGTGNVLTIGADSGTTTFAGVISGLGGLTKDTAGSTQVLSGTNTYTGATTVTTGTLTVSSTGSLAAGSTVSVGDTATLGVAGTIHGGVTVASGGTLAGNGGTFNSTVAINGIHSPGASPGLQTFTNGLAYGSTAILNVDLVGDTLGLRGTDYDGVDVTGGNLSIDSLASLSLTASGIDYTGALWDTTRDFTVIAYSGGGTSSGFFALNTTNAGTFAPEGSWSLANTSNNIVLSWTPVPEPGTAALGLLGTALLLRRRRTKHQS